ncbi:unnamed protein product [Dovyalis caffra]|uniref:Uncharacterized protein n=1 Tax=Dovyalis caffra TaxID=77055 RepID=A0AAV1SGB8_9ROSI|nr:unnamed protein product [Dovyalis caffra]
MFGPLPLLDDKQLILSKYRGRTAKYTATAYSIVPNKVLCSVALYNWQHLSNYIVFPEINWEKFAKTANHDHAE